MATLFMDNFEIYGNSSIMLDGMYAEISGSTTGYLDESPVLVQAPAFSNAAVRKVLPSTYTTLFTAMRLRVSSLPSIETNAPVIKLRDSLNANVACMYVDTTGRLVIKRGDVTGAEIARSASPVVVANTFHHIEVKWVIDGATGSVQVRIDDNTTPVINVSGVNTAGGLGSVAQIVLGMQSTSGITTWWTDFHVWDTTGTRNIDFLGDVAVTTLWPNVDVETGWTPNYRHKIGSGVLDLRSVGVGNPTIGTAVSCADAAVLDIGSGDFTIETFVRFNELPSGSNRVSLVSKWLENGANNQRSYQLSKCGPSLNSGNIEFRISTDGSAGTVTTLISQPWEPETDVWYNVCVVRNSGETMLFIDGVMQGVPVTDTNTYFNSTASFFIGGQQNAALSETNSVLLNSSVYGWLDETRFTNGVGRYTGNYTPTTSAYPRNSSGDPDFASVVFLAGWDTTLSDESSYMRTVTSRSSALDSHVAVISTPDDGSFQYQTINAQDTLAGGPPRDDTNISASLYRASAVLTLGSNPVATDTVDIGVSDPVTYKFVSTLVDPYDVLIGTDEAESLANLVAAINQDSGEGTIYGTGTAANTEVYGVGLPSPQCKVVALLAGASGNSIPVAYSGDGSWDDAYLTGGADIPGPSSFRLSRMPPGVTSIRSVQAVTRAYKTESGPAKMQTNFVGPSGTVANGTEVNLSIEPAYSIDVFEADPDTTGPITPATLVQGRIQFDRTE